MEDCGIMPSDIDGVATAGETPAGIAHYLGITPTWVDGTAVGGCSFMLHVRHAAAAINEGLCDVALVTHGESGRSRVGMDRFGGSPASLAGQYEAPYGMSGPPSTFTLGVLRYMKETGMTHEQLASVSVVQREWAALNPRSTYKDPITVDDVLNSRMIAYPLPPAAVLPRDGRGRSPHPRVEGTRAGLPDEADLPARHRRERRDADDQPDGRHDHLARPSALPEARPSRRPASPTATWTT